MNRTEGSIAMFFTPIIPTITLVSQLFVEYGTLTRRRSAIIHVLARLLSLIVVYGGYWYLNRLGVRRFLDYYLLTIAYLAACLYLFAESPAQKIFMYFTVWGYSSFVSSLCAWTADALAGSGKGIPLRYALYASAHLLIIPLYFRYARGRVRVILALFEKGKPVYAAYPAIAFVLFTALFGPSTDRASPRWFAVMLLFESFIIFSYYLLFSHFHAIYDRTQAEARVESGTRQASLQRKYYEQFELGLRRQRELLHDARHHLVAIAALQASGKGEASERYVRRLLDDAPAPAPRRFCENDVANAVIGGYIELAEEKGVAVSAEIDLPDSIGIDDYELCTVFGNTIENALEACQRIPEGSALRARRYVDIKSRLEKGRLVIRVENSYANDLDDRDGAFASSKGALGGVGLQSVRSVVERYGGCLSLEPGDGAFRLSAVLYARGRENGPVVPEGGR